MKGIIEAFQVYDVTHLTMHLPSSIQQTQTLAPNAKSRALAVNAKTTSVCLPGPDPSVGQTDTKEGNNTTCYRLDKWPT